MRSRVIGALAALVLGVVGTAVLVGYVRGAEARALDGTRTVNVLVVNEPVAEGTAADQLGDLVASEAVPAKVVAATSVASLDQLEGQVAAVALEPGEQVLTSRFADPASLQERGQVEVPEGMHQVTVALDPERALGGQVAPGDTVGVFISMDDGHEGGPTTHLVLHKVLVTGVQGAPASAADDGDEDNDEQAAPAVPDGRLLVTLATRAPAAERLVFAAEHGSVWLSSEPGDAGEDGTRIQHREEIYR
jgi:pilus assembly protein CpaB